MINSISEYFGQFSGETTSYQEQSLDLLRHIRKQGYLTQMGVNELSAQQRETLKRIEHDDLIYRDNVVVFVQGTGSVLTWAWHITPLGYKALSND